MPDISPEEAAILFELDFDVRPEVLHVECQVKGCKAQPTRAMIHPPNATHMVCQPCAITIKSKTSACARDERVYCGICGENDIQPRDITIGDPPS